MRKLILTSVLALAVSATVLAEGDMQFGRNDPPPAPTPTPEVVGGAAPSSDRAITNQDADDPTEALLNLIASVLALL